MTDQAAVAADHPFARFARSAPVRRLRSWYEENRRDTLLVMLVALFVAVYLAPNVLVNVSSGHAGVIWRRFGGGTDVKTVLPEGISAIWPWDRVTIYDLRVQVRTAEYEAIANDGLHMKLTVAIRFRPDPDAVGFLHKAVGPNYVDVLLVPEIGSAVRREASKYLARDIYGQRRAVLQGEIYESVVSEASGNFISSVASHDAGPHKHILAPPRPPDGKGSPPQTPFGSDGVAVSFIELADVLISDVVLPERVRAAIERKQEQDQLVQEYTYRLERERFESQRKAIEADGIRQFQETVQAGISETYLKWRGIEATLRLAASPNAKVVVIGGQNGLPLILNTGDSAAGTKGAPEPGGTERPPAQAPMDGAPALTLPNEPGEQRSDSMPATSVQAPSMQASAVPPGAPGKPAGPVAAVPPPPLSPLLSPFMGIDGASGILNSLGNALDGALDGARSHAQKATGDGKR